MIYHKLLSNGEAINSIREMYKSTVSAVGVFEVLDEEAYHQMKPIGPEIPYWDYYSMKYEAYVQFMYNLRSMTLIQMYAMWERQRREFREQYKSEIAETIKITELKYLTQTLKHGKKYRRVDHEEKLRILYPEYFVLDEVMVFRTQLTLNLPPEKVDEFADAIMDVWRKEYDKRHCIDIVQNAVWLGALMLTYERVEILGYHDVYLRQTDIQKQAQKLCSKTVQGARISQWYNGDHEGKTYNYLRARGAKRRLTKIGEFDHHREHPVFGDFDPESLLSINGTPIRCSELIDWYKHHYSHMPI